MADLKEKHLHSIKFIGAQNIPDEIKKEISLTDEKGIIKISLYEQAHELEGLKNTIESAGFDVVNKLLMVKRGDKIYQHVDGEKIFYIEDVNAIKEQYAKEQQQELLKTIHIMLLHHMNNYDEDGFSNAELIDELKKLEKELQVKDAVQE